MRCGDDGAGRLLFHDDDDRLLMEYVYRPTEPQVESPRPYALLSTRGGVDVTAYRPPDHVWHKGLSLALPVVGPHNFWGGPTYVRGRGYVQCPNNGAQVHRAFTALTTSADEDLEPSRVVEELDWVGEDGSLVLSESRELGLYVLDAATWGLNWRSTLRNETGGPLRFGSPTTEGRPNAGYAGIFWRGPGWFTGGEILGPGGRVGDAARGEPSAWLAFIAPDRSAGVLMAGGDDPWFARSAEYAGLIPAPFFHEETILPAGDSLSLAAGTIVGDADVTDHAGVVHARGVPDRHPATGEDAL